jgi:hypothetical protein
VRRMSFALTESQLLDGTKTVTRRLGWRNLKPGDRLLAVDKCMGLRRGQRSRTLATIVVVSVMREPLHAISPQECEREGFPGMPPDEFVEMFIAAHGGKCTGATEITRIRFEKLKETE